MDSLPLEIVQKIFLQLSQRNIATCSLVCQQWYSIINTPVFYSTINIYTVPQLKKFINISSQIYIQDKPMIHYVRHLIIHFTYEYFFNTYEYIIDNMINIQSIDIPAEWYCEKISDDFPRLDQLIHRPKWYKGDKHHVSLLKSLEIDIPLVSDYQLEKEGLMYLIPIGPLRPNINYMNNINNNNTTIDFQQVILILPSSVFYNLIYLNINFNFENSNAEVDILDERTLELIHQSCPQLEILKLNYFHMGVSDEYNTIIPNDNNNNNHHTKNNIERLISAISLKELEIDGILMDDRCFTYLLLKYSHLESFTYNMTYKDLLSIHLYDFDFAFYDMITKNQHLKRFSFDIANNMDDNTNYNVNTRNLFPQNEFIQWLIQNPNQFEHLSYPFYLMQCDKEKYYQNMKRYTPLPLLSPSTSKRLFSDLFKNLDVIQHSIFLTHLSSLSMDGFSLLFAIFNYLGRDNAKALTVSDTIMELSIYSLTNNNCTIDLLNYLDVFPNLKKFKISGFNIINGYKHENPLLNSIGATYNEEFIWIFHQLIKERKEFLGIDDQEKFENKSIQTYQLRELELERSRIRYRDGLDFLFDHFNHLNRLSISDVLYCVPERESCEMIDLNLPHLSLNSVFINGFKSAPWNSWYFDAEDCTIIDCGDEITIEEVLTKKKYNICKNDWYGYKGFGFDLTIKCNYLDDIVYIK